MRATLFSTLIFFMLVGTTGALTLDTAGLKSIGVINSPIDATIEIIPEYPRPNTKVQATLRLDSVNTATADIAWVVDNVILEHGKGLRTIEIKTGDIGEKIEVNAVIKPSSGPVLMAQSIINPSSVVLLQEAEVYTPPFYKGRSRFSADSFVRLEAIAEIAKEDGSIYPTDELTYVWSRNSIVMPEISGVGRSFIRIQGPSYLGSDLISVDIRDNNGSTHAQVATFIKSETPQIILYEKRPLIGHTLFNAITDEKALYGRAINIVAEPYFIGVNKRNSDLLKYTWSIDGQTLPIQDPPFELKFSTDESAKGKELNISVDIKHLKNAMQNTRANVRIGVSLNTSNFGL